MRINTEPYRNRSHGKLESIHVRYAVLSCMNYTNKTSKLDEMLCYVLLCSYEVANKMKATERIFEVIDIMAEIIGRDYKDDTAWAGSGPGITGARIMTFICVSQKKPIKSFMFLRYCTTGEKSRNRQLLK